MSPWNLKSTFQLAYRQKVIISQALVVLTENPPCHTFTPKDLKNVHITINDILNAIFLPVQCNYVLKGYFSPKMTPGCVQVSIIIITKEVNIEQFWSYFSSLKPQSPIGHLTYLCK